MKLKIIFSLIAVLFVGLLVSLNFNFQKQLSPASTTSQPTPTSTPPSDWKKYENKKYGISFNYPATSKILGDMNSSLFSITNKDQVVSVAFIKQDINKSLDETFMELIHPSDPQAIAQYLSIEDYPGCNSCHRIIQDKNYFSQQAGGLNNVLSNLPVTGYSVKFQYSDGSEKLLDQILSTFKFTQTDEISQLFDTINQTLNTKLVSKASTDDYIINGVSVTKNGQNINLTNLITSKDQLNQIFEIIKKFGLTESGNSSEGVAEFVGKTVVCNFYTSSRTNSIDLSCAKR